MGVNTPGVGVNTPGVDVDTPGVGMDVAECKLQLVDGHITH